MTDLCSGCPTQHWIVLILSLWPCTKAIRKSVKFNFSVLFQVYWFLAHESFREVQTGKLLNPVCVWKYRSLDFPCRTLHLHEGL